jgi:3-phenylpropionate/cinnamic acid dioxygenase small subunit
MATVQQHYEIEQILYHEAWLLERRRFNEWLELLTEDIVYWIPNAGEDGEASDDAVIAYENLAALRARATRSLDPSNPTQMPPPRTKYFITNVAIAEESRDFLRVRAPLALCFAEIRARSPPDFVRVPAASDSRRPTHSFQESLLDL